VPRILSDDEIAELWAEPKPMPDNWERRLAPQEKSNRQHRERDLRLTGNAGHEFRVVLRQSVMNPLDFSVILTLIDGDGTEYRLLRYNGRHPSPHTNKWEKARRREGATFESCFHIHKATERYQVEYGAKGIDGYAEPTERYGSIHTALRAFLADNGFIIDGEEQLEITDGMDGS